MKGVTPIVAIIILLLITIALAGAAYTYLQQYFQSTTGKNVQIVDAVCTSGGIANLILKNIGTQDITLTSCTSFDTGDTSENCGDITFIKSEGGDWTTTATNITPNTGIPRGSSATFKDYCGSFCSYRFITSGAGIGAAVASVQC